MELSKITQDDDFRCRTENDEDIIEAYTETFTQYREAEERGEKPDYPFPPVWVRKRDDETYTLITGFHRDTAARRAGLTEIQVKVFTGTEDDALWLAMRDNRTNGKRLSSGDIRFCIEKALKRFPDLTAGAIAVELGCSRSRAYEIENELSASGQLEIPEKRTGADGKVRSVKRENKKKSGKGKTKTSTTTKENKGQLPTLEEQVGEATVILNGFVEKQPSDVERVRFLDKITEWVTERKANLSPPQDKTVGKKKRSCSL
jgi:hypothetical protein